MPTTTGFPPLLSLVATVLLGFAGAHIGYKQRDNSFFFYFALFCVLILTSLLAYTLWLGKQQIQP